MLYYISQQKMSQQIYKLSDFGANYQRVEKDKKKQDLKSLEFILELNKSIGFDQILLREGFQNYPQKDQIVNNRQQANCLKFYQYLKQNLESIQSSYLKDTNDLKQIEQSESTNQKQYNFLLNKNSVSKFVRDEASHYQKVLDKYLQAISKDQQQKGVQSKNMHNFLIDLFSNKYIVVLKDAQPYLTKPIAQVSVLIGNYLSEYGKTIKELTDQQAKCSFFITEEEMLDFMTFWLKQETNTFILYARTQQRLNKQSKFITNQSHLATIVHPSRMTAEQIIQKQQQIELVKKEQLSKSHLSIQRKQNSPIVEQIAYSSINSNHGQVKTLNLKSQKSEKEFSRNDLQQKTEILKKDLSKQEMLKRQMKNIFQFGCKRRYNLNKNTTFEDIQQESKTMTFEKFLNFCKFFQLTSILTKQLITQYFKQFALNLRLLDYPRFESLINKMVKVDVRVAEHLLKKIKFEVNHKKNQIKNDKRAQQKVSSYKFVLHPINGKDVSTLQKELTYRKLEKMIVRQQKQRKGFTKREKIQIQESNTYKKHIPYRSVSKISHAELQPIRDTTFNPQKLILSNENDKLWDAYQAKIWNKEQNSQSALQSILSKRIQRGNIVINKLHSQRSFIYDQ